MTWVICDEVIEGDIIRFTEAIWERRGPKRKPVSYTHLTLPTNREV